MRCLYCGRELALLKRLTGNGEFCSDQHKQSYHDEYNRLALSRLLQAQTKTDEGRAKSGKAEPVAAAASHAGSSGPEPLTAPARRERGPALPTPIAHKPEPVATGAAGFLPEPMAMIEGPGPKAIAPSTPLSWIPGPVFPIFNQVQPIAIDAPPEDPPMADPMQFQLTPLEGTPLATVQVPEETVFGGQTPIYPQRQDRPTEETFDLPMAGPVAIPGIAAVAPAMPELSLEDSQPFFPEVFQLLVPSPAQGSAELQDSASIEVRDGELNLPSTGGFAGETAAGAVASPSDEEPKAESDAESLKRLQNGLQTKTEAEPPRRNTGRRTELPVVAGPVVDGLALDSLFSNSPRRPSGARLKSSAEAQAMVATLDVEEEAASEHPIVLAEATAPFMEQILPITLRIVSPAKARLASESRPLLVPCQPQLTTTEILPLRPRIGLGRPPASSKDHGNSAPGAAPSSGPSSPVKVKPVKNSADFGVPSPARVREKENAFDPREAVLAVKRSIQVPDNKPALQARRTGKARAESKDTLVESQTAVAANDVADTHVEAPVPTAPEASPAANKAVTAPQPKPAPPVAVPADPRTPAPKPSLNGGAALEMHFGTLENPGFLAKLPMGAKIGIAIVLLLAIGGGGYLIFSGAHTSSAIPSGVDSAAALSQGDGAWITDWAGDSTGVHKGRKIDIYRPSLKLTDYAIAFQGKIEANALGWVFRATNASNFYAVKLTGSGASYRLTKYTVIDGKERESGQVAVRPVNGNTFPVRVEVRGDHFTTFIGNRAIDTWVDNQLKSGGVGFLNDLGDRAEIANVGISLLPGTAH